jgi:hypothetical protein
MIEKISNVISRYEHYFILIAPLVIIAFCLSPILSPGLIGIYDWDGSMQRLEAIRLSIIDYGQFPGNNPWVNGGQPLFSGPYFTIETFLSLLFGTRWGLRISICIYVCFGYWGSWKLSSIWWKEKIIRMAFSFYTTFSVAVFFGLTVGHGSILFMYWLYPMFLYLMLALEYDKYSGLKAGLLVAISLHITPIYTLQYGLIIALFVFLYIYIIKNRGLLLNKTYINRLANWILQLICITGVLTFHKVMYFYFIGSEFPRTINPNFNYTVSNFFNAFLYPNISIGTLQPGHPCGSTWEMNGYLGITAIVLFFVSLIGGIRWWHTLTVLILWASAGDNEWYYIMHWIHKLPTFSSHLCTSRVRYFAALFLGICASNGIYYLYNKWGRYSRFILLLCIPLVMEVMLTSYLTLKLSHVKYSFLIERDDFSFVNVSSLPRPQGLTPLVSSLTFFTTQKNIGWLKGFGDSFLPTTNKIGSDQKEYKGEYYQVDTRVNPSYWSPNKIIFENLEPGLPLTLNMNPGRLWYVSNKPLFPGSKIVEMETKFIVIPGRDGRVELEYRIPGGEVAIYGTAFFFFSLCSVLFFFRKKNYA